MEYRRCQPPCARLSRAMTRTVSVKSKMFGVFECTRGGLRDIEMYIL